MGTWVVGDIHGCYNDWKALEKKVELVDANPTFILVGDIVDRGKQQSEMLHWAFDNITENGKYQMIIGNHEYEKIEWFFNYNKKKAQLKLSTLTKLDYDRYLFHELMQNFSEEDRQKTFQFFLNLPYYKELYIKTKKKIQHYIVVHSTVPSYLMEGKDGVDIFHKEPLDNYKNNMHSLVDYYKDAEPAYDTVWDRIYCGNNFLDTIVVHGHTPTLTSEVLMMGGFPARAYYSQNDINIDCGCVFRENGAPGNLMAIQLEDLQEVYVHEIGELSSIIGAKHLQVRAEQQQEIKNKLIEIIGA